MDIDKITLMAMEAIMIEKDGYTKESAKKCSSNEIRTKLYERLKKLFLYNVSGSLPSTTEIEDSKKEFKEGHAKVGGDDIFGISWEYAYEEGAKWAMKTMIKRSKQDKNIPFNWVGTIPLAKIEALISGLRDIKNWDDSLKAEWGSIENRAKYALEKWIEGNDR